ncbi:MAG: hypothetical protein GY777_29680 [Candidatus Brocadiaceae bacterium]|nr:hypothetical protein [Candidatus Brocadiaceae bacterium]
MRQYLKIFLSTGVLFGLFTGIFYSVQYGVTKGIILGISGGLFFGFFMSLILGTMHKVFSKRVQSEDAKDRENVHQIRKIKISFSFDSAFDACIKSIDKIKKSKILEESRSNGKIDAKVGMTWKTFGDRIKFIVTRIDENNTEIEVSSRPAIRTTLVDYGKNLENVQIIEDFIKKQ